MPEGPSAEPLRDRIVASVRERPGASAREIQRRLGLAWGETAYHLDRLTQSGEIRRERGGWRDYYFPRELTWTDRRILQSLQSPAERSLLLACLTGGGSSFTELVTQTGLGRSTASFHLHRLVGLGVLRPALAGEGRGYDVVEPARVQALLTQYATTFADSLVDRFAEAFGGLLRE